ncbi:MAG: acetate--CoA ligase [Bacteroidetes bacterium]|nr:acetate--CoA ligase [Bacteroidota bacterium]
MAYPYQIKSEEQYKEHYKRSVENPEAFWAEIAENFSWRKKWNKVLEWDFRKPKIEWFIGGKLNITENCLDRHLTENANKTAILWEPNNPHEKARSFTYKELFDEVCLFANVLRNNGIKKGDRVCIYLPMVPELSIAMLACARIGAIHSVVFGGFSAIALRDRIDDAGCSLVITSDGAYRGEKQISMKDTIDDALLGCESVKRVIVLSRTNKPISMIGGRDVWWDDEIKAAQNIIGDKCEAEEMDAEDMLFILYTSGSTGKPKGVVHTTGGYMVWTTYTFVNTFQYSPDQIHFCTADLGWITGHSYTLYGPLCAGATTIMFEGIPTYPDAGRFWDIVDKYKVDILYTAPTAIRSLMASGVSWFEGKDLSSLKVLGSVGEPINEEAWHWYDENVGKKKCPIVDTWWQTETAGIMISNLAGVTPSKPTFATLPLPGVQPVIVDDKGNELAGGDVSGNLCIKFPWPGIVRDNYGNTERYRQSYFSTYENLYFSGDGCLRDNDGNYRITGRVDDVLNVSGHRIGTAEVENAINMHTGVVESAVVAFPHAIKGEGIYAYVILKGMHIDEDHTKKDINETVSRIIGAIAKPDKIQFVKELPKTRSGKIMRRILRKIAEKNDDTGDTSTLLNPGIVDEIKQGARNM